MKDRKHDHIQMAFQSRMDKDELDHRFYYEPVLSGNPSGEKRKYTFLGKTFNAPLWISSMTGGTEKARTINHNLARVCKKFGLGMGLGSCRALLYDKNHFDDFDLRNILGDDRPFYANLGIAQLEELISENKTAKLKEIVEELRADGIIIHVNPLQEWLQPEGNKIKKAPLLAIRELLERSDLNIIVKEVGQGMGPESLKELLKLPLVAVEFGAFGGTNFAKLELMRSEHGQLESYKSLSRIGHTAADMVEYVNNISESSEIKCKEIIISGGIKSFLDGFYLIKKCNLNAIYGQASQFLEYANESYQALEQFVDSQIKGLHLAESYLRLK